MDGDDLGLASSDSPIACLNADALSLVFQAVHDAPWERSQSETLRLPLTLSHVCRRWRAQALEQPSLWSHIVWHPGNNLEAALAMLERSRASPLTVHISLRTYEGSDSDGDVVRDAQRQAEETVFRALIPHFSRTLHFTLEMPRDILDGELLTSLISPDVPCAMPQLKHLNFDITKSKRQGCRLLNISCPPLAQVSLDNILPLSWEALLGQRTTTLRIRRSPISVNELQHVLKLVPNLRSLDLSLCEIFEDGPLVASRGTDSGVLCTQLDRVVFYPPTLVSLVLMRNLPIHFGRIRSVTLRTHLIRIPFELSYEYMRISELVGITGMSIYTTSFEFATAGGVERKLGADATSVAVLHDLFASTPVLSTVTALTVEFHVWPALLGVMATARAPDAVHLPRLEKLRLLLSQEVFEENAGGDDGLDIAISAPALTRIEVAQRGLKPPTKPLVQRFVRALKGLQGHDACLFFDGEHTRAGNTRLAQFLELLREEMSAANSPGLIPVLPQP